MEKSNIVARTGSAIAKNKEAAKLILTKYKIDFGTGKTGEIILSAFKAIKAGNKELAVDLAGLVQVKESKTAVGQKITDLIASIQKRVSDIKASKPSSADGDPIATDADSLITIIESSDPEILAKEAESSDLTKKIIYILILLAVVATLIFLINKYWK